MINNFQEEHRFLSNFFRCHIMYKGKQYATAEHLYQALKTKNEEEQATIRNCYSPGEAKRYGRKVTLRPNWEEIKDKIMWMVVKLKFTQHINLAELLKKTEDQRLLEGNYWHDNYWGNCYCNTCCETTGKNMLGKILMKVRVSLLAKD